jgi:EmrB/QacA subfamily drug resistance transporter
VLAICSASVFVVVMDISIVNVALPTIRRELHASESDLQWTVDAYTLVLAGFLVLAASTADRVGRRRVFQIGLIAFGLGSLLCATAPSIDWLIAARVIQALGGTMLNPVAAAIVATTFTEPAGRARAIGLFASMTGLSQALGPVLGGALVHSVGWYSIFWINLPVVAAATVLAGLFVPESRATRARRFDPVGQTLVVLVLGCLVYAIIESRPLGWTSPVILGLLGAAGLGMLGILGYEPRRVDPLLELRLFRSRSFSAAIVISLLALCGFSAFLFVATQYLQDVRGMSALAAGVCLLPIGTVAVILAPLTGRLVAARGPRLPLAVAGSALAAGGGASMAVGPTTSLPAVLATYLLFGILLGTVIAPITSIAVAGMPASMAALATSFPSAARHTGTTLGVAISGTVLGAAAAKGGTAFTGAAHGVWWLVLLLGAGVFLLALTTGVTTAQRRDQPVALSSR